ncbi:hypothetical protein [Mucilaginibacter sp.]|uniref:hypothetical protein n=1 Tax=Mucilaginibacter sp. TaxID=1882438 RepID=UPI00262350D4|nr:hypothetical protein [Mucilaginibacter sp.]MDB5126748.1 hypothetical protein [Mucilaginibacter sp.]
MIHQLKFGLLLLATTLSTQVFGQNKSEKYLKPELVGTWEFSILKDHEGHKIDTIITSMGKELVGNPIRMYRSDGTYAIKFTPQNTDNGQWYFDNKNQSIIQLFYYSKPYSTTANYLISLGHAKKDENGDYYEIITTKVIELTENNLTILEREGRQRTFIRKQN